MSLPRYPEYKDSGVAWLGDVPGHWEVTSLKRSFQIIGGSTPKSDKADYWDGSVVWVSPADLSKLTSIYIDDSARKITDEGLASCGTTLVPSGSIVLSTRAPIGSLAIAATSLCTNQGCKALVPRNTVSSRFFAYLLLAATDELNIRGRGTTFLELSADELGAFKATLPGSNEQTAIATFLDHETAKIDTLIAEQEKLLTLLAEKRQATISHAVTKGLNPDAPMKDSGVEWLGEVPAHWDVLAFQRCVFVAEGQVNPEHEPYRTMILIAPNHVESGTGRILYLETAEEQGAESGKYLCNEGDVIYSKIRPALRKVCIAPTACLCSADMYPLRGTAGLMNSFLLWFMLSEPFSALAVLESERVAMPKINRESLKAVWLAQPPVDEQLLIASYLDTETQRLDALSTEATSAIDLLKERRTALISAAVTGKIDVRHLANQEAA